MLRLRYIAILLQLLVSFGSLSQSGYSLDFNYELGLYTGAGLSIALGLKLKTNTIPYDSLHLPPARTINKFDRTAISNYSVAAKNTSNIFGYASFALPAIFLIGSDTRRDFGKIALIWGEVIAVNAGLTTISKHALKRPRPYVYSTKENTFSKSSKGAQASFVSGHTSVMASNLFFLARTFSVYHHNSKLKPYVWGICITAPAIMGHLRVKAGVHYPTDVIAGYALGAAVGLLIPELHKKRDNYQLTVIPVDNGIGFQVQF
jgi:membrane-associated phospholipid phosphatase